MFPLKLGLFQARVTNCGFQELRLSAGPTMLGHVDFSSHFRAEGQRLTDQIKAAELYAAIDHMVIIHLLHVTPAQAFPDVSRCADVNIMFQMLQPYI